MRSFVTLLSLLILTFVVSLFWFQISIQPKSKVAKTQTFIIYPGQKLSEISKELKKQGFIKNALAFRILAAFKGLAKKIQAGSYQLSSAMSTGEILNQLTFGTFDVWVTIPEGLRVEEIAEILNQKLGIAKVEFLKVGKEGQMFPDTYLIPKKAGSFEIAEMMLDNFNQKIDANLREKITRAGFNLQEVVILASIVEREVKFDEDRPVVAGILVKRLQENLPLGADATVQYALGYSFEEATFWRKTLTNSDLQIDSPYNTRKFPGLPPGPICNPGLASVKAVVEPVKTPFYYYLSDSQGKMHYAVTLTEHNENIKKYL